MTFKSLFDLSTMQSRHLLAAYVLVIVVQGGYLASIGRRWIASKRASGR